MKPSIKSIFFPIAALLFSGCEPQRETICEPKICTMEFRTIHVQFVGEGNQPVAVKDYKVYHSKSKTYIPILENNWDPSAASGYYPVAHDGLMNQLSEKGDELIVSATHSTTGVKRTAKFIISGGKCACHISKISGPEIINF